MPPWPAGGPGQNPSPGFRPSGSFRLPPHRPGRCRPWPAGVALRFRRKPVRLSGMYRTIDPWKDPACRPRPAGPGKAQRIPHRSRRGDRRPSRWSGACRGWPAHRRFPSLRADFYAPSWAEGYAPGRSVIFFRPPPERCNGASPSGGSPTIQPLRRNFSVVPRNSPAPLSPLPYGNRPAGCLPPLRKKEGKGYRPCRRSRCRSGGCARSRKWWSRNSGNRSRRPIREGGCLG